MAMMLRRRETNLSPRHRVVFGSKDEDDDDDDEDDNEESAAARTIFSRREIYAVRAIRYDDDGSICA